MKEETAGPFKAENSLHGCIMWMADQQDDRNFFQCSRPDQENFSGLFVLIGC
jgi:hypothetical protein